MSNTSQGNGSSAPWQMGELSQSQAPESQVRGSHQSPPVEADDSELQPAPVSQSLLSDSAQDDTAATVHEVEACTGMNTSTRALLAGINEPGQDGRAKTSVAAVSTASSLVSRDFGIHQIGKPPLIWSFFFGGGREALTCFNMFLSVTSQASPITAKRDRYKWLKGAGATPPVAVNGVASAADGSVVPAQQQQPIAENDPRAMQSELIGSPSPRSLRPAQRPNTDEDSLFEEEKADRKQPEAVVEVRQWRPLCLLGSFPLPWFVITDPPPPPLKNVSLATSATGEA